MGEQRGWSSASIWFRDYLQFLLQECQRTGYLREFWRFWLAEISWNPGRKWDAELGRNGLVPADRKQGAALLAGILEFLELAVPEVGLLRPGGILPRISHYSFMELNFPLKFMEDSCYMASSTKPQMDQPAMSLSLLWEVKFCGNCVEGWTFLIIGGTKKIYSGGRGCIGPVSARLVSILE